LYCSRALLCLTETNELSASRLDAPRRTVEILVLSPLGVLSQFQNRDIGTRLVEHALAAADAHRAPLVFLQCSPYHYANEASNAPTRSASAHHRQLRRTDPHAEVIPTGSFNHASAPDMVIRPCAPLSEAATEAMEPETDIKSQV
jgi:GNAT superfamily N-acetyltransferase